MSDSEELYIQADIHAFVYVYEAIVLPGSTVKYKTFTIHAMYTLHTVYNINAFVYEATVTVVNMYTICTIHHQL